MLRDADDGPGTRTFVVGEDELVALRILEADQLARAVEDRSPAFRLGHDVLLARLGQLVTRIDG
ncbi:hypothetical protein D3C83_207850 [compost metagenome]